jgi:tRNA-modifying protein YgfZ
VTEPAPSSSVLAADYHRLRHEVGAVALPRDVVQVTGPDAFDYLQGQCSQDLAPLDDGDAAEALLLSPQGKLDALVRVVRLGPERFALDVEGGFGEAVVTRLLRFRLRVKVDIEPLPWRCVAVRGPGTATAAAAGLGAGGPDVGAVEVRVPWSWGSLTGVDLLGPDTRPPAGVPVCDPTAWEAIRVEAGIPRLGAELDERTIAAEAGLVERTVSFTKGCYTGQELVARLDARGNRVARHLRGLVLAGDGVPPPGAPVAPAGAPLDTTAGAVTSSAWSFGLDRPVALAYLHRSLEPPAAVEIRPLGRAPESAEAVVLPIVP